MTIRHLRIFAAVCEAGSVTKAAERLYMSQPAVSLAIKELEENYGVRLFERMPRKIRITDDGQRVLEYAIHIVELFGDMERAVKNPDMAGEIRVGSSLTIGARLMPGYVKELSAKYPGIRVRVRVDNSDTIVNMVREGKLDMGLIEGTTNDDVLTCISFMADRLIAICPREHKFAAMQEVVLEEFLSQPLLLRERGSGTRELFQSAVTLKGGQVDPEWESISTTAILRAVEMCCGVSVLPEKLAADSIIAGRICPVKLKDVQLSRHFNIIYHRKKYLSTAMATLMEIVTV